MCSFSSDIYLDFFCSFDNILFPFMIPFNVQWMFFSPFYEINVNEFDWKATEITLDLFLHSNENDENKKKIFTTKLSDSLLFTIGFLRRRHSQIAPINNEGNLIWRKQIQNNKNEISPVFFDCWFSSFSHAFSEIIIKFVYISSSIKLLQSEFLASSFSYAFFYFTFVKFVTTYNVTS